MLFYFIYYIGNALKENKSPKKKNEGTQTDKLHKYFFLVAKKAGISGNFGRVRRGYAVVYCAWLRVCADRVQ